MNTLNYTAIYLDIINDLFPEKKNNKELIDAIKNIKNNQQVLQINNKLFVNNKYERNRDQQKLNIYTIQDIEHILNYQVKNKLNDSQTACHFKMSRNTLKKWKDRLNN